MYRHRSHIYARLLQSLLIATMALFISACSDDDADKAADASELLDVGAAADAADALVRKPPAGELIGFASPNGAFTWLGIPFAQPPVGELRWRAPRPLDAWETSLLAGSFGSPCVQLPVDMPGSGIDPNADYGDEDCLYLNIYAPPTLADEDAKLPVMLWIHGGGNTIGEASQFDGSRLAVEQNVVVVTINYRLGPFGWFKQRSITGDGETEGDRSGNFGTLDMIRALEWTRDNIAAFGGDAGNVTIFGESAGGRNVVTLLLSPLAEGLFHRAIVQSGASAFIEAGVAEHYHPYSGDAMVATLNADQSLSPAQLRQMDAHQLLKRIGKWGGGGLPLLDVPNVFRDGYVIPLDAGIQRFRNGDYNKVPVMLGTTRDEQKLFMFLDPAYTKKRLGFWQTLRDAEAYNRDAYYMSVRWRITGAEEPARAIDAPVYVYRFDWDEQATPLGMDFPDMIGAAHGLELAFIFGSFTMGEFDQILITEENQPGREQLATAMMTYWANFARSGDPNKGSNVPTQWLPWSAQEQYLILDTETEEGTGIRMSQDTTTFRELMLQLQSDERFESQAERCAILLNLASGSPELLSWKNAIGC